MNTADVHKFSGSTSYSDIVDFFLDEIKSVDQLNGALATLLPIRHAPVVIHAGGGGQDHKGTTNNDVESDCSEATPPLTAARQHDDDDDDHDETATCIYKPKIYSFVPRKGARVATLVKKSSMSSNINNNKAYKKRKRDSFLQKQHDALPEEKPNVTVLRLPFPIANNEIYIK